MLKNKTTSTPLPHTNETEIQKILLLLRTFQKIDPEFPLQYAICLFQIANQEGLSLTDLAKRSGMALSTVSRIISALSGTRQIGTPYGLVNVKICATERRKKEIFLTPKGQKFIQEILRIGRIV